MSKWDKYFLRIKSLDKNMRFEELQKVLEAYGYKMERPKGGSSHCSFRKKASQLLRFQNMTQQRPYMY